MITFDYVQRCKLAITAADFPCKLILDHGLYALFPDGHKEDLTKYEFMRTSTLTKWLNVLYLIRKERAAYGDNIH